MPEFYQSQSRHVIGLFLVFEDEGKESQPEDTSRAKVIYRQFQLFCTTHFGKIFIWCDLLNIPTFVISLEF